jgi:MFS superfamily sulfate permease-like transporter
MKSLNDIPKHIGGLVKDVFVIALVFTALYFIDIQLASFVALICTILLLTRRKILDHNPGFILGHHIIHNRKQLKVPKGVDIFDLCEEATMDSLRLYTEVINSILASPRVLVIRLCRISEIEENDLFLLKEIISELQKNNITVVCSDVEKSIRLQFKKSGIDNLIGTENICHNITDALFQAGKFLNNSKRRNKYPV